ncbi:MAG: ferredoxin [Clostridiales bacterium]|nr:ferredoxin [Clostridiales bacterium]
MKAIINEGCIGCGICVATCPSVFRMGDHGKAEVYEAEVQKNRYEFAMKARDDCPVSVIDLS